MALSSDLAAAFSLIQQQQALEERKEERHQSMALNLLSMEMRETESARNVLIKEYYDKKTEMAATEEMYKKYEAIDPDLKTQGAMELIQPIVKKDKIDMEAIIGNLDILTTRESELQAGLTTLESQGQKLKELQSEFWGVNKTLQPHEYYADPTDDVEQLQEYALKPVSEGGLGWDTTAGMDYEYSLMKPSEIEDIAYA